MFAAAGLQFITSKVDVPSLEQYTNGFGEYILLDDLNSLHTKLYFLSLQCRVTCHNSCHNYDKCAYLRFDETSMF